MEHFGFWSVLPPVVAIAMAIRTRQVILSLLTGLLLGWIIINRWNPMTGLLDTIEGIVDVFKNESSTQTILFTLFIGSLIAFIQKSGGVEGFIKRVTGNIDAGTGTNSGFLRVRIQLLAAITGLVIFVESNISVLTVGAIYRPLTDKLRISREKLAYLADSTSAPSSILIPLNAWGGFIMGLLLLQGIDQPFALMIRSIPYNFYPLLAIIMVFIIVLTGKDFGPMRKSEERAINLGKVIGDNATPMVSSEITFMKKESGVKARTFNMIVPIAAMVFSMPLMLIYTGWDKVAPADAGSLIDHIINALGNSSGSASVLYSVLLSLIVSAVMYLIQGIFSAGELFDLTLKGMSGMITLAILMVMAFAIGNLCNELGTGIYVATLSEKWLSPHLVPFIIFLVSCFIAFSTGTSWGTFAIMISIAVPVAQTLDTNIYLAVAAALGGGVFGDHCSPISDPTIISSMASASDHIDHVKTQLPYALTAGAVTAVLYLLLGFLL